MYKEAPKGWQFVPADKYCAEVTDGTHDSPKPIEYSGHYLLTSKNITSGILNYENAYCISEEDFNAVNKRSKVNQYDLLYSMIGTVGESCIVDKEIIDFAIKNVGLFRLNGDLLKAKWLNYFFKSNIAKTYVEKSLKGATQKYIALGVLRKFPILIPSATAEQQEIVQVLDTMSDIIRLREECISHAQDLIPALFQEMFKNYENNTILLSSICDIKGGKRLPSGEKLIDAKTEHPYLRVTNFKNQNIDMNDIKYITEDVYKKISRYVITTGDIYISIAGTIGLVGDIPNELNNANLTENAARLIIDKKKVNKKYLIYCLNSTFLQRQIKEATVGVGVPKLALSRIGTLKIYLPDIKIQEQFAQKAIEIEAYIKEQNEELKKAEQMFQSLLHHAFTGELTRRAYEN